MTRRLVWFGVLVILAVVTRLSAYPVLSFDGRVTDHRVKTAGGFEVAASVYTPRLQKGLGAVVLCHGISASRHHMDPLAKTLARRGLLVVAFDYGGHGRSQNRPGSETHNVEDVQAGIALARSLGATGSVALVGHSMGVTSAAAASLQDPTVVCVVALGQRPFVSLDRPRALLMADGTQDMFHPYPNLKQVASEAAGRPVGALDTVYDPDTGAVRRLFLSASCEHAGEVYDGAILGEVATFITAALGPGGPPPPAKTAWRSPLSVSLRFVSNLAAGGALILLGLLLGAHLRIETPPSRGLRRKATLVLALAPVIALGLARYTGNPAFGELGASLLFGLLVAGALLTRAAAGRPIAWRAVFTVAGVLLAGWIGGTVLGAAPAFWERPELLKGLPLYAWQGVAFRFEFSVDALAARLAVGNTWPSILGLLGLLAVEVALPGKIVLTLSGFLARLVNALGGRFSKPKPATTTGDDSESKPARATPRRMAMALALLIALIVIAGVLFAKRASEGLLSGEGAMTTVASAGLRMLVLPVVAAAAALWIGRGIKKLRPE